MLQIGGFYFPDGETHFPEWGDRVPEYQKRDRDAAYQYVKRWRRALDVGANVGIFARDFATRFDEVVAFEPFAPVRECLALNVTAPNVRIEPVAVADAPGVLELYPMIENSGMSFICNHPQIAPAEGLEPRATIRVEARTIDSYNFDAVDLIKLDIEGGEYPALLGAQETILRHRPVIMVEEKAHRDTDGESWKRVSRLLKNFFGMTPKEKFQIDRVYVFED